jgi:hypothetical protein
MTTRKPRNESPNRPRKRKNRSRPTPKWLRTQQDLDEVARRRCVMILATLSGVEPVSEVIEREKISRGTYYQLETRALRAMLGALTPGAEPDGRGAGMTQRIAELEKKTARLEQEKRRAERLLFLTKQVIKGPVTTGLGRPKRKRASSTSNGNKPSPHSSKANPQPSPSTPTAAGAGGR